MKIPCHPSLGAGITNCVGTMGTALTMEHLKLLRNALPGDGKGEIVINLDGDSAGVEAVERACREVFLLTEGEGGGSSSSTSTTTSSSYRQEGCGYNSPSLSVSSSSSAGASTTGATSSSSSTRTSSSLIFNINIKIATQPLGLKDAADYFLLGGGNAREYG